MVNKIAICAEACRLSYDDNAPGFFTVGDLRYGIYTQDGLTVLAIRGTANAENWGRDCSMLPGKSPKGYLAHSGFIGAYNDLVESGIFWKITTRTVVTGHSLGGAIATLVAEAIGCELITFGSPRVYFRFSSAPVLDHIRIIGDDDPVPMIPKLFYRHTCAPVVLRDGDGHWIDVKDHSIDVYIQKLKQQL